MSSKDTLQIVSTSKNKTSVNPVTLDHEQLRDQVWKEYREKVNSKTCTRCGEYVVYSIQEYVEPSKGPEGYNGQEDFYILKFGIEKQHVSRPGEVTDPFYHLCNRCINHVKGIKKFEFKDSIKQVEIQLAKKRADEQFRRWKQEERKKELGREIRLEKAYLNSLPDAQGVKDEEKK